ncbi:P-loop containing nucleoside triphosphate hydrolase protein [Cantharellus anzutake]|uniref:P-loop containing nucleoside triphosphate hydrolase protein n=1 Tax=Cantharellus anzutake TaxID=1750568 RepID=UPI0019032067|nr:P-loop containing nucleoside triphosphate hydrolase protein [Cantharellus anzutake]KAF8312159.1 P-loop containing nucleoside triphosphate hydrolase protein [Cantharellus anzutake]
MPPSSRKGIVKSGNVGNSSKGAPKTPDPEKKDSLESKPLFPPGFKTPISLLHERCQKLGWDKPNVEPRRHGEGFTCSITLSRDHKSERESVRFVPHPPLSRPTAIEAKHWGATYALHRFSNNLQLHRLLPPGPREYWADLEAVRRAAPEHQKWMYDSDPFSAQKSVKVRQELAAKKKQKEEEGGNAASSSGHNKVDHTPEVRMAATMRDSVERVIREMASRYPGVIAEDTYAPEAPSFRRVEVEASLRTLGFQRHQIEKALNYITAPTDNPSPYLASLLALPPLDACVSYMLLHVPESDLPVQFKSQQTSSDPFVRSGSSMSVPLALQWSANRAMKEGGWPERSVMDTIQSGTTDWGLIIEKLGGKLLGYAAEFGSAGEGGWDMSERYAKRLEEIEAVQSVYPDAQYDAEKAELSVPLPNNPDTYLNVVYSSLHPYPSPSARSPPLFISSAKRPSYIRLHLLSRVLSALQPDGELEPLLLAGEGAVFGAIDVADNELLRIQDSPPEVSDVMKHLIQASQTTTMVSRGKDNPKPPRSRGRFKDVVFDDRSEEDIKREFEQSRQSKEYAHMLDGRMRLPAWNSRDEIVRLVDSSRVVVVVGETGCGKTTQLPQFILDACISKGCGSQTKIVVTQPRRVSALGVSARVSAERMEDGSVGYAIRGESRQNRRTKLLFCTTGVLLRRLTTSGYLSGVSHVIVDEVHERSVDSDFLLLELRELLKHNKEIKIILMSATINQSIFVEYFNGAPVLEIPGFTHPVQDIYLEDVIPKLKYLPPPAKGAPKQTEEQLKAFREEFEATGLGASAGHAIVNFTRSDRLDYHLISSVVSYIVQTAEDPDGAILVFLTGVQEIRQCMDVLRSSDVNDAAEILPLHANLSSDEQRRVFAKTPKRKIVLATNVAETSITIPEVVYVVDCGKAKENQYDVGAGLSRLVETWVTKAAAKQRRGRAGRTRPGKCYKLYTRQREAAMKNFPVPEILRVPLESLSLQIKVMRENEDVRLFLAKALDPPKVEAIDHAWNVLEDLGAVDSGGKLTALGQQMALLPVDLRLGKMMILGTIFRCLDPILTIAACVSSKPLFLSPMDKKEEANKARLQFATANSDLLTDVTAYNKCRAFKGQGNTHNAQRRFMEENFISASSIRDVTSLRQDFLLALSDIGFIPLNASATSPYLNVNSDNTNLVKGVILGGLWPRATRISMPKATFDQVASGTVQRDHVAKEIKIFDKNEGRVFLHPGSVLFGNASYKSPYLAYFAMTATTKTFLRDATEVPLYALLLLGGQVTIDHIKGGITVGKQGWIKMRAWSRIGVLVNQLRLLLDAQLQESIEHAEIADVGENNPVIQAMVDLITNDGLVGD